MVTSIIVASVLVPASAITITICSIALPFLLSYCRRRWWGHDGTFAFKGQHLRVFSNDEARMLAVQMQKGYLQNGIAVNDGDCVVDAGANIGMFSILLMSMFRSLHIVALEPVPFTFALAAFNLRREVADANGNKVSIFTVGLSDVPHDDSFPVQALTSVSNSSEDARLSEWLSRHTSAKDGRQLRLAILHDLCHYQQVHPAWLAKWLMRASSSRYFQLMAVSWVTIYVATFTTLSWLLTNLVMKKTERKVTCDFTTVSCLIQDLKLEKVDLLKLDIEGAEWKALQGIDDKDWPKIRQIVVEVHDDHNGVRVQQVSDFLQSKGFRVTHQPEESHLLQLLGITNLFAIRM